MILSARGLYTITAQAPPGRLEMAQAAAQGGVGRPVAEARAEVFQSPPLSHEAGMWAARGGGHGPTTSMHKYVDWHGM